MQHLDRAREPLDQPVVDRLVGQHPRGRRALLARVVERRLHQRGHHVVEIGVGVHDHAVLPAHLGHDTLQVPLAGRHLRGAAHDLQPDRAGAGERDRVHARVADQRRADRPLAGQQRQRARRQAGLAQRPHDRERTRRRLLGRLQDDRVAGRQPGRDHPQRDRDREVPGRDHGDDPARTPAQLVALAGELDQLRIDRPGAPPARSRRARSTRGSRSPRTRRRPPRATAWPSRAPRARRSRAVARAATARRRRAPPPAPRRVAAPSRCGRRDRARGRRRPRTRSRPRPRPAPARRGRSRAARHRSACRRRPTPAPGSRALRRTPPARPRAAPAPALAATPIWAHS